MRAIALQILTLSFSLVCFQRAEAASPEESIQDVFAKRAALFHSLEQNENRLRELTPEERLQQRDIWKDENHDAIAAVQDKTRQLAQAGLPVEWPFVDEIHLPSGATSELEHYFVRHAELHNLRAELENELLNAPADTWAEQRQLWLEEHRQAIEELRKLAETAVKTLPFLPAPAAASDGALPAAPALQEIISERSALFTELAATLTDSRELPAPDRHAAILDLLEWQAPRRAALDQKIQTLASPNNPQIQ